MPETPAPQTMCNKRALVLKPRVEVPVRGRGRGGHAIFREGRVMQDAERVGLAAVESYFGAGRSRLSQHHLDSYNEFVENGIPRIVEEANRSFVMIKKDKSPSADFAVRVHDVTVERPTAMVDGQRSPVLPNVCRATGATYAAAVRAKVSIHIDDHQANARHVEVFDDVTICMLPVMLRSGLCHLAGATADEMARAGEDPDDPGGYFVVSGGEKVIVSQERTAPNRPIASSKTDAGGRAETAVTVRSASRDDTVNALTIRVVVRGGAMFLRFPGRFVTDVDIAIVFRALGVESDEGIVNHVHPGPGARREFVARHIAPSLVAAHSKGVWTQDEAVAALARLTPYGSNPVSARSDPSGARGRNQAVYILRREFLVGTGETFPDKAIHLGRIALKALLVHHGIDRPTDRESLCVKRMFTSGMLLAEVFREAYAVFKSEATNAMDRAWYYGPWRGTGDVRRVVTMANVHGIFSHHHVTNLLSASMMGNWGGRGNPSDGGIVQELSRLSWQMFVSHLRRTNNPIDRDIKITSPHYIHTTKWGAICPVESPDGGNIGLTNNLAIACEVTAAKPSGDIVRLAMSLGAAPLALPGPRDYLVLVNWVPTLLSSDPVELCRALRAARRSGSAHHHTSVRLDIPQREVRVCTDGGRCIRPVFIAPLPETLPATWDAHLAAGTIEYIDAEEAEDILVAWSPGVATERHTHSEIHPIAALSALESTMPFMQHNQAARNVLAAQQGKQAAGIPSSAFKSRLDTVSFTLDYPHVPLVSTRLEHITASDSHPCGANSVAAIMTFTGFNMEDGVILNKASVDRGLFSVTYTKVVVVEEEESSDGVSVRLGNPGVLTGLDANGLPVAHSPVVVGSPMYSKVRSAHGSDSTVVAVADESWGGFVVDRVFVYQKPSSGLRVAKIRYRRTRPPVAGDKLAARHAQKGVVGAVVPEHLLPFTSDGIVPDIIVNPHAFPTRMTIGQLFETVGAKACAAHSAARVDATPFNSGASRDHGAALLAAGLSPDCTETVFSSATGAAMRERVFIGPTYYQRLKQMVDDKINYRGPRGARDKVTRQPVGGRANGGGLRVGEMEYNCIAAHGVMGTMAETHVRADGARRSWLDGNGAPAVYNESVGLLKPSSAPAVDSRFRSCTVPQSFVALRHEVAAMGIDILLLDSELPSPASEDVARSCGNQ